MMGSEGDVGCVRFETELMSMCLGELMHWSLYVIRSSGSVSLEGKARAWEEMYIHIPFRDF